MDATRLQYLKHMGVDVWERRGLPAQADAPVAGAEDFTAVNLDQPVMEMDWVPLKAKVSSCTLCGLHSSRTQTVFGVGNPQADWLIIGEAPGADEDRLGEPFVGRAGKLLDNMLRAIGFAREDVFIANILKCRPPKNRDPKPEEADACAPYLLRQIQLIQPRVILAVGRIAAQNLLMTNSALGRMRGKVHIHGPSGIPVVVTYHPAYLLRTPSDKRKAWQDLLFARDVVEEQRA
ncbi:MAG: uracil-DNA glycosylase [Gammaproteobacteria bacterium]|nr:uracil-DNA glycosylase [Gammaproteobacteria bacterium]